MGPLFYETPENGHENLALSRKTKSVAEENALKLSRAFGTMSASSVTGARFRANGHAMAKNTITLVAERLSTLIES